MNDLSPFKEGENADRRVKRLTDSYRLKEGRSLCV